MTPRKEVAIGKTANPPVYRVLAKCVVTETGCWEFTGSKSEDGYGIIRIGSRKDGTRAASPVHRVTYEHFVGPIPDGLTIDHLCRNVACVNPDHLEAVSQRENNLRGTSPLLVLCRNNVCKYGHSLLDPEHVALKKNGKRYCRTCNKQRCRERRLRILG